MEERKAKQKDLTVQEIQNDKNLLLPSSLWLGRNGQQTQGSGGRIFILYPLCCKKLILRALCWKEIINTGNKN